MVILHTVSTIRLSSTDMLFSLMTFITKNKKKIKWRNPKSTGDQWPGNFMTVKYVHPVNSLIKGQFIFKIIYATRKCYNNKRLSIFQVIDTKKMFRMIWFLLIHSNAWLIQYWFLNFLSFLGLFSLLLIRNIFWANPITDNQLFFVSF